MPTSGGTFTGAVRFQQSTYFGTDNSYYVGSDGTANFRKVYGAVYNDYAEWFPVGAIPSREISLRWMWAARQNGISRRLERWIALWACTRTNMRT